MLVDDPEIGALGQVSEDALGLDEVQVVTIDPLGVTRF